MPLWNGPTWLCEECGTYNAVLRKSCRTCGTDDPGPYNSDPEMDAGIRADVRAAVEQDFALGLLPYQQPNWKRPAAEHGEGER